MLSGCNFSTAQDDGSSSPTVTGNADQIAERAVASRLRILDDYTAQFQSCDRENVFNGRTMRGNKRCRNPNPRTCDLNNLDGFYQIGAAAISFSAELSVDVDGGYAPCAGEGGSTDLCPTTYRYRSLTSGDEALPDWRETYVTSDLVPYVVIPYDSLLDGRPNDPQSREFRDRAGIQMGDVGVVVDRGNVVPVFVADGGPHNKIGEGSLALFDALGDTRCARRLAEDPRFCAQIKNYSLGRTVEYIMFPGSAINGLTPSNTNELVSEKAMKLYNALK
jgi:hypothetical protein